VQCGWCGHCRCWCQGCSAPWSRLYRVPCVHPPASGSDSCALLPGSVVSGWVGASPVASGSGRPDGAGRRRREGGGRGPCARYWAGTNAHEKKAARTRPSVRQRPRPLGLLRVPSRLRTCQDARNTDTLADRCSPGPCCNDVLADQRQKAAWRQIGENGRYADRLHLLHAGPTTDPGPHWIAQSIPCHIDLYGLVISYEQLILR
jgi:hypothetical protein